MTILEALKGKTITAYELEKSGDYIVFTMNDGSMVRLNAYGDCCSTTWIESLDAPDALLGTVKDVREIDMPDRGNIDGKRHKDVHIVQYYGIKITTNKGRCVIDYRNDSNGYYGGSLEVVKGAE